MPVTTDKSDKQRQILQALAAELERKPGSRITTAALAKTAGVSASALYRHFPHKAEMFEALIGFAEETVFARVNHILAAEPQARERCAKLLYLLLGFAERNPGITRVLLGEALVGENGRLRGRVDQFFGRFETQLRQVLREAALREGLALAPEATAQLLLSVAEGRLQRYLRSGFEFAPTADWDEQWRLLERALLAAPQGV